MLRRRALARFASLAFVSSLFTAMACAVSAAAVLRTATPLQAADAPAWNSSLGVPVASGPGPQLEPVAVPDGAGGAIIAFEDHRGAVGRVTVQRVAADGSRPASWPAAGIALTSSEGATYLPRMVSDEAGGVFVAWEDSRSGRSAVFVQHILTDGRIAPGWPHEGLAVCTAEFAQRNPALAPDGAGGVLVSWQDDRRGAAAVHVQRIASDATIQIGWLTNGVPVAPGMVGQELPRVASDAAGGAYVVWEDARAGQVAAYAQHIEARGVRAPEWPHNGLAVSPTIGRQDLVRVAPTAAGGLLVAWRDWRRGTSDLMAQGLRGDGTPAAGWPGAGLALTSATGERAGLDVVSDGAGGLVALWEDYRGGGGAELYLQRLDAQGRRPSGWSSQGLKVAGGGTFQLSGSIVVDAAGLYLAWQDFTSNGSHVQGQRLNHDGTRPLAWPEEGLRLTSGPAGQLSPHLVRDEAGGAILVWEEGLQAASVHAARVGAEGLQPAEIAVVETEVAQTRVRVRWRSAQGASFRATIERATPGSDWAELRSVTPDHAGEIAYEDPDVEPGRRYGYRLAVVKGGAVERAGEVWVETPGATTELALGGFVPNPTRHGPVVAFSLPETGPAMLDMVDVTGRRVRSRDVGELGPGRHVVHLGGNVPPGFYVIRLTYGGRTLTTRGMVIR